MSSILQMRKLSHAERYKDLPAVPQPVSSGAGIPPGDCVCYCLALNLEAGGARRAHTVGTQGSPVRFTSLPSVGEKFHLTLSQAKLETALAHGSLLSGNSSHRLGGVGEEGV